MPETVISVENLSKAYRLGVINHGMLYKDIQSWWARLRGKDDPNTVIGMYNKEQMDGEDRFWALKDICFDVKQGDRIGIIGKNGAGKSTLLKILSRVTAPTSGNVRVKGRIASLLEVGTGFHPELTGRENVHLNGAILGMTKDEITKKFHEIVDFAGIDRFIDTPVKRYSSGMYVRLAFAVAAHLEPEILVVDEVLAVGDVEFQKKAIGKMEDVSKEEGRTILFVSHNMAAVDNLCTKSFVLNEGKIAFSGTSTEGISYYMESIIENGDFRSELLYQDDVAKSVQIKSIRVHNHKGVYKTIFEYSESIFLNIEFIQRKSIGNYYIIIVIVDSMGNYLYTTASHDYQGTDFRSLSPGKYCINAELPGKILKPGKYRITISITESGLGPYDKKSDVLSFEIIDTKSYRSKKSRYRPRALVAPDVEWSKPVKLINFSCEDV